MTNTPKAFSDVWKATNSLVAVNFNKCANGMLMYFRAEYWDGGLSHVSRDVRINVCRAVYSVVDGGILSEVKALISESILHNNTDDYKTDDYKK
jgi:hypothetical protein